MGFSAACFAMLTLAGALGLGNRKEEGGAPAELRLDPERSSMALDYFLADSESDTRAGIVRRPVEPLEDVKDPLVVRRSDPDPDPDAVIADGEDMPEIRVVRLKCGCSGGVG